jgi:DNA-binding transcriptional LysR family regulator
MTFLKPARNLITAHERAVAGLSMGVRRIGIGISDQIAGPGLPVLLRKLSAFDPGLIIEVHINSSPNIVESFDKEELDAAIVRREDDRRDGELLVKE